VVSVLGKLMVVEPIGGVSRQSGTSRVGVVRSTGWSPLYQLSSRTLSKRFWMSVPAVYWTSSWPATKVKDNPQLVVICCCWWTGISCIYV